MKHLLRTFGILALVAGLMYVSCWYGQTTKFEPNVIERMMQIQRDIGCTLIDGEWGPESQSKYEIAKKEIFNQYASEWDWMYKEK